MYVSVAKELSMAIGWFAVLQMVPWVDVIKNAPKVANEAKKLWNTIAKKPPLTSVSELQDQLLASSELIKKLADQNAQLIKQAEVNRRHILFLTWTTILLSIVSIANLTFIFVR